MWYHTRTFSLRSLFSYPRETLVEKSSEQKSDTMMPKSLDNIPVKQTVVLLLSGVVASCSYSVMHGYLPDVLYRFGVPWTVVGVYQGQIMGITSLTKALSNFMSGFLIDKIGGYKYFIACTLLQSTVMAFSAFAFNIPWLYISAFLIGLSSNQLAAKWITFRISNESNASKIMTYGLSLPGNFGMFLGPAIGGLLALPTFQYPNIFDKNSILDVFVIMLPNLFIGLLCFIIFLSTFCLLLTEERIYDNTEVEPLLKVENEEEVLSRDKNVVGQSEVSNEKDESKINDEKSTWSKTLVFLTNRNVIILVCSCLINGVTSEPSLNVISLWSLTPINNGGLGYTPNQFGKLKLCASVISVLLDLVVPVMVLKMAGYIRGMTFAYMIFSLSFSIMWLPSRITDEKIKFTTLLTLLVVNRASKTVRKVAFLILLKNIIPPYIRGRVLAIDALLTGVCRIAGHAVFGKLYSWSLSNLTTTDGKIQFPFNEPFSFYAISILAMLGAFLSIMCTEEVEKPLIGQNSS